MGGSSQLSEIPWTVDSLPACSQRSVHSIKRASRHPGGNSALVGEQPRALGCCDGLWFLHPPRGDECQASPCGEWVSLAAEVCCHQNGRAWTTAISTGALDLRARRPSAAGCPVQWRALSRVPSLHVGRTPQSGTQNCLQTYTIAPTGTCGSGQAIQLVRCVSPGSCSGPSGGWTGLEVQPSLAPCPQPGGEESLTRPHPLPWKER